MAPMAFGLGGFGLYTGIQEPLSANYKVNSPPDFRVRDTLKVSLRSFYICRELLFKVPR